MRHFGIAAREGVEVAARHRPVEGRGDGVAGAERVDEVRKLREAPLTPAELQSAKDFTRGRWAVERDTLRERAFRTARAAVYSSSSDNSHTLPLFMGII